MQTDIDQQVLDNLLKSNVDFAYYYKKMVNDYEQKLSDYNQSMAKLQQHLEESQLNNSKFIHELRNQATIVKSTTQLFEACNQEVMDMKYWDQVVSSINIYETYITEYNICNNSNKVFRKEDNLEKLIISEVDKFRPISEQTNIGLSLNISEAALPYYQNYFFDQVKLKHVFTNLIRNAFEATTQGNYIAVECDALLPNNLIISVTNNGKMIPADELSTIFNPYVTYKVDGCGLGLAIVNNVITAHDGTIHVESTIEKTCFTILLPIKYEK
jgi:two-component system sensor histidine kinase HydH